MRRTLKSRIGWLFNTWMMLGWLCGALMVRGCYIIDEARDHKGSGIITYENEQTERVPEDEYRRWQYGEGATFIAMGMIGWYVVAMSARKDNDEASTHQSK